MTNSLIRTVANPVNFLASYQFNYSVVVTEITSLKNRVITNEEEYFVWVADWKRFHAELVGAIQYFRMMKNRVKYDAAFSKTTNDNANTLWSRKKILGQYAKVLYNLRIENKLAFKAGLYEKMEAAA